MVEGVVHQIIQDVKGEGTGDDSIRNANREQCVGEASEREFEYREKSRRHYESEAVHRQIMMNAMRQKMEHEEKRAIRKPFVNMEQKSVQSVLEQGPNDVSNQEAYSGFEERRHGEVEDGGCGEGVLEERHRGYARGRELEGGEAEEEYRDWEPEYGDDIPWGAGEHLHPIRSKEPC